MFDIIFEAAALVIKSEDLQLFISGNAFPMVRIDAHGWLEVEDMQRLRDFLNDAIEARRSPSSEENNYESIIRK